MTTAAGGVIGPEPVDWRLAERVARGIAGRDRFADSYLAASLHTDFAAVSLEAEDAVADYTGLRSPGPAVAEVVDRSGWVAANVRSMRTLLAPLTDRFAEGMAHNPFAPVGRRVAGTELGFLLGYVAQRVLGQYDLSVPDDDGGATADRVVLRGCQRARAREAVRVPTPRLPALDRDPRGHAPGAVHRRAVAAGLLPRAGAHARRRDRTRSRDDVRSSRAGRRRGARRPQPRRRTRVGRAVRERVAARGDGPDAGTDVAPRGPRQRGDEPPRRAHGRRSGANGLGPRAAEERAAARRPSCTG